jgi:hypothetical protein
MEARRQYRQDRGKPLEYWHEFGGDTYAEDIVGAWIEHLDCPQCEGAGPFIGDQWGTVECLDCEHVWTPDWSSPWAAPTPRGAKPRRAYSTGSCPICWKVNRRMDPDGPHAFLCRMPKTFDGVDMGEGWGPGWISVSGDFRPRDEEAWQREYEKTCLFKFQELRRNGWMGYNPVSFPFCHGCGSIFAARLPDELFCSPECGPRPANYAVRLRRAAVAASPVLRRSEVFARDGWFCYICGEKTDPASADKMRRPSIDHVQPIVRGGHHTMENVRTAHLGCNFAKADRLFGPEEAKLLARALAAESESGEPHNE